jgi:poly(A) polymerase
MKVSGDWLRHAGTQTVLARLTDAGFDAYAVGGCVRNDLLDAPVADIYIATSATPAQVIAACEGLRVVPTGIDHGTVTLIAEGRPHEITTFRRDVQTDGRHAVVAFGTDMAADAARRDFTMNALYAAADGTVIDPLGGLRDLLARQVRFIGDADARIIEDRLRILRFFRFTAWYGDALDADGLAACAALAEGLDTLSRERVGAEMAKLLAAPDPAPAVAAMAQSGILTRVIAGADARALAPLVHLEAEHALPPDWRLRMAALGGDTQGLRLSRADAKAITQFADMATGTATPFAIGHGMGGVDGLRTLLLRAALFEHPVIIDGVAQGAAAIFPLRARDLAPLSGPALGAALNAARALWTASDGTLDAAALRKSLDSGAD